MRVILFDRPHATAGEQGGVLGTYPVTGAEVHLLRGPYGWYLELAPAQQQLQDAAADAALPEATGSDDAGKTYKRGRKTTAKPKPKRVSLGRRGAVAPDITLKEALELLQWPKVLSMGNRLFL